MSMSRSVLRVCAAVILSILLVVSGVYAVEPWSMDLWKDLSPSPDKSNATTPQSGSTGGGIWSDQLWQDTPVGQPTVPPVEKPKPTEEPKPVNKPLPATKPHENSYILVMQVANNSALVRGVEKELVVPPTIINGQMMIPLRFTSDALKATFTWSGTERKTTIELDGKKMEIWSGKSTAIINGKPIQLDTPPVILDGSTLVPVRFVSENFGYLVEYEAITKTIKLRKPEETGSNPKPKPEPKPEPIPPKEEIVKPSPEKDKVETEIKRPVIDSNFNYFGVWNLRMDGLSGGLSLGTLIVQEDGTYGIKHGISGSSIGTWRQGEKNEVIGHKDMLILEDGPDGMDWVIIPKADGIVSVRYHYGYDIENKIWFEDCLGIKVDR